jgi:hydrogenase maturation protease
LSSVGSVPVCPKANSTVALGQTTLSAPTASAGTAGFTPMRRPDYEVQTAAGSEGKLLVLGLGNDILCDDAVGLMVVREIRNRLDAEGKNSRIEVQETCEMGLSLLDYIVGYQELVLVDSIQTGRAAPGFVHELDGKDIKLLPVTTPHFLGVGEMMAVGKQLGLTVPQRVKIFAIEVQDPFTITTKLSPALQTALPEIVSKVWASLATCA